MMFSIFTLRPRRSVRGLLRIRKRKKTVAHKPPSFYLFRNFLELYFSINRTFSASSISVSLTSITSFAVV